MQKISESCNLDSENAMLKDQEVENFMFDVLKAEYEPFSSLRILSQHHLYKKFKDEIRVVIDGSGVETKLEQAIFITYFHGTLIC